MKRFLILATLILTLFLSNKASSQSTQLGVNTATKLTIFEYYNHVPSEWIKVFRVKNADWQFGGVVGSLYFVDYQGEGASRIDFVFPQSITVNQKPLLTLFGNSSRDITLLLPFLITTKDPPPSFTATASRIMSWALCIGAAPVPIPTARI